MKLTKKVLAVLLATLMVVVAAFAGCSASKGNDDAKDASTSTDAKTVKFGLITLHDENSTYDKNFIAGVEELFADHNIIGCAVSERLNGSSVHITGNILCFVLLCKY